MHVVLYQIGTQCDPLTFHFNVALQNITTSCVASINWASPNIDDSFIHAALSNISCKIIVFFVVIPLVMFNKHVVQDCTSKHDIVDSNLVPYQHVILYHMRHLFLNMQSLFRHKF